MAQNAEKDAHADFDYSKTSPLMEALCGRSERSRMKGYTRYEDVTRKGGNSSLLRAASTAVMIAKHIAKYNINKVPRLKVWYGWDAMIVAMQSR